MAVSDEEDSEFERFLQASLSSSSASNRSLRNAPPSPGQTGSGRGLGGSGMGLLASLSLGNQWLEGDSESEKEQEALKWLKPPHKEPPQTHSEKDRDREGGGGKGGREGGGLRLEVAVPTSLVAGRGAGEKDGSVTYDYTKDSLEVSSTSTALSSTGRGSGTPSSKAADFQDTFSAATESASGLDKSGRSSALSQSGAISSSRTENTVMGADTLEENVEKERFFAAMEAGRSSPLDYSELNRQLGDTGLTSLTMGSLPASRPVKNASRDDETPRQSETSGSETETETIVSHNEEEAPAIKGSTPREISKVGEHSKPSADTALSSLHTEKEGDVGRGNFRASFGSGQLLQSSRLGSTSSSSSTQRALSDSRGFSPSPILRPSPHHTQVQKEGEKLGVSFSSALQHATTASKGTDASLLSSYSSLSSHRSLSEGRGFALSPIQKMDLTASGSFLSAKAVKEVPVVDRTSQSGSPSPSPAKELVAIADVKLSPAKSRGRASGSDRGHKNEAHVEKKYDAGERTVDDFPHILKMETKALASSSRQELRVETEIAVMDKSKSTEINLPLPRHVDREKSPRGQENEKAAPPFSTHQIQKATAKTELKGKAQPSKPATSSSIEIHMPAVDTEQEDQLYERTAEDMVANVARTRAGEVRESRATASEEEVLLEQVSRVLEDELGELQSALEAAGLPMLGGGGELNDSSFAVGEDGTSTEPIALKLRESKREVNRQKSSNASSAPSQVLDFETFKQDVPSSVSVQPMVGGGEVEVLSIEGGGSSLGALEGTIRALAAEELTSITKQLLLQDTGTKHERKPEEDRGRGLGLGRAGSDGEALERKGVPSGQRLISGGSRGGRVMKDEKTKTDRDGRSTAVQREPSTGRRSGVQAKVPSPAVTPSTDSRSSRRGGSFSSSRTSLVGAKTGPASHMIALSYRRPGLSHSRPSSKTSLASTKSSHPDTKSTSAARRTSFQRTSSVGEPESRAQPKREDVRGGRREAELETLQSKVESLKQALAEEKARVESLQSELLESEEKHRGQEEALRHAHTHRETQLEEEVSALTGRIQEYESSGSLRQHVKVGGAISEEEREELQASIQEQETLLHGYQKENERLYSQLTEAQHSLRGVRGQLTSETQGLRTELANARAQLEHKVPHEAPPPTGDEAPPITSDNGDIARIARLEDQLERSQDQCRKLERQVTQLKHSLHCLEHESRTMSSRQQLPLSDQHTALGTEEVKSLQERHKEEVGSLKSKLQWYAENQQLVDADLSQLREKEAEIAQLRERLAGAERAATVGRERRRAASSRSAETRKVHQLERQVRDLNDIIKKRFPNSLSALIMAANSAEQGENPAGGGVASITLAPPTSAAHLKRRVKELEGEVERRAEEERKRLRALQQKYSAMELLYEQQLSSLREELEAAQRRRHQTPERRHQTPERRHQTPERREKEVVRYDGASDHGGREEVVEESGEISQLRDQVAALAREKGQLLSRLREDGKSEELVRENEALKTQLSTVQLEAAHRRVRLESQLAEAEASAQATSEETAATVSSLRQRQAAQLDSIKAQFARQHSQSAVASLRSNLSSLQVECGLLREKLETAEEERQLLSATKEREDLLSQQIKQLSQQLVEAKRHHTPEMHHFSSLLTKISTLESRISDYESLMNQRMERLRQPISDQLKAVEHKWQREVQAKDTEISQFRAEVDSILTTLHALQTPPTHHTL